MKIEFRALNKGERFCCSQKAVKAILGDCEIKAYFAYFNRDYQYGSKTSLNKKYDGKIIAYLHIDNNDYNRDCYESTHIPILQFYVLQEEEFSKELEKELISKILPRLKSVIDKYGKNNPDNSSGYYIVDVELLNGKLIVHERIARI